MYVNTIEFDIGSKVAQIGIRWPCRHENTERVDSGRGAKFQAYQAVVVSAGVRADSGSRAGRDQFGQLRSGRWGNPHSRCAGSSWVPLS